MACYCCSHVDVRSDVDGESRMTAAVVVAYQVDAAAAGGGDTGDHPLLLPHGGCGVQCVGCCADDATTSYHRLCCSHLHAAGRRCTDGQQTHVAVAGAQRFDRSQLRPDGFGGRLGRLENSDETQRCHDGFRVRSHSLLLRGGRNCGDGGGGADDCARQSCFHSSPSPVAAGRADGSGTQTARGVHSFAEEWCASREAHQ